VVVVVVVVVAAAAAAAAAAFPVPYGCFMETKSYHFAIYICAERF
jgi:hypothetical protein